MRSRIAPATALFITLAILNSFPLVLHPATTIGQHGDAYFSVWRLAWVAHQLVTDPVHLFDGNIFYPHHDTLAYSDAMLLPAVTLAPLAWLGVPPVVVYNFALLASFVASGVAAFLLVRELTGSFAAGLLGGIIFGFSPHRLEHFDHLELQFAFWMPLAALAWHRAIDKDRGYLAAGLFAAGQVMSSIYHGVFLVTWLGVLTAIRLFRDPRRAVRAGVLVLAPPVLVLAIYSIPYMRSRAELGDRPPTDVASYSALPSDFLSAPRNNRLYGWTDPIGANERHLFPGVVATLLLIVGLWPPYDRTRLLHAAGLALALELTLGFNGGLYQLLYEWVLPFRGLRVPARADILVLLGTAVLAGFGLTRLRRFFAQPRLASITTGAVLTLTCLEFMAAPTLIPVQPEPSVWYRWLKTVPDAVIFEWPVTVPWRLYNMVDVKYMYWSTAHWRPLLNGYSGYYPDSYIKLLYLMRSFPDTGSIAELQRRGATILVVHESAETRQSYTEAVERLVRDPSVKVIAEDKEGGQRVTFFRLAPAPANAARN